MFIRIALFLLLILELAPGLAEISKQEWDCGHQSGGDWGCQSPEKSVAEKKLMLAEEMVQTVQSESMVQSTLGQRNQTDSTDSVKNPRSTPIPMKPLKHEKKESGWSCGSSSEGDNWNCSLVGFNPRGQARLMEERSHFLRFIPFAFDLEQEQNFEYMQSNFQHDPWGVCTLTQGSSELYIEDKGVRTEVPVNVHADYSEIYDQEIASFQGDVELSRADQQMSMDQATYDKVSQSVDAQGNIYYRENSLSILSDSAFMKVDTDQASLRDVLFVVPSSPIRGNATAAYQENKSQAHFNDVAYTSCAPGNQDWVMHGARLKVNNDTGRAAVKHAWLDFKGVPSFYLPYLSFPIDDRRQTGLLTPGFGSTQAGGFDFKIPFYWNIAPNYDATIWARYLTKRGPMFGSEFRYLTRMFSGSIEAEILPNDQVLDTVRWQGSFKNHAQFTQRLSSDIDVNYVSDEEYFNDLGDSLNITQDRYLRSFANIAYNRPGVQFMTLADNYQSIDENNIPAGDPYRRLPQVLLNLDHSFDFMPLDLGINNEFVYFESSERVNGQRLNTLPWIDLPLKASTAYLTPRASFQYTQYWLQNQSVGKPDNITRALPIFSVDSGLVLEKQFGSGNSSLIHTIEPRLFYLYVPEKNQDDIPIFDTSEFDFTFLQMFRENRFNGPDRLGDANQLTVAMTTRLLDSDTGQERLNLSLGNIIYFRDRTVQLIPGVTETSRFSNIVAELQGQLTDNLWFFGGLQWDPQDSEIDRGSASIRYRDKQNHIFNIGYRYRQEGISDPFTVLHQTNISFLLPLYDNWSIVGRWQYSILDNLTLESYIGLEKDNCCWRFRILGRRYVNDLDSNPQTAIFVQFELKGLSSIGNRVEEFLQENLTGYRVNDR